MDFIAQLAQQYFLLKMGLGHHQASVDWALERLRLNQEGDDLDIVLLAAATTREEAMPWIESILQTHLGISTIDDRFAAGKYIASLHTAYLDGQEIVESLDEKFTRLFHKLEYPGWLVMLSRNCEYATDVPAFREPFEQEFEYVAGLWAGATSSTDFESKYSRIVSNSHDVKNG